MVLWSIWFITNRHRISPQQISLCPLLLGPDQSHYNQSRRWSRLHTKLAQITRIAPKWIYTVLKIFSQFTILEQLALDLKITELLWKFSLQWIYFLYSGFLSNLRLPWKRELPWNFSLYWICIFYHSGFLSNQLLSWKQSLPWNFSNPGGRPLPPTPRLVRLWLQPVSKRLFCLDERV